MHSSCRYLLPAASITLNLLLGTATIAGPHAAATLGSSPSPDLKIKGQIGTSTVIGLKDSDMSSPYGSHLKPILEKIKANPDQRTKIGQIVDGYKSRIQPLRDEYKVKRQEFIASMTSGGTAETIMTKQVELSHLSSEISSRYCLMRLEIRRQLTPQQILQFEDYARANGWNSR